MLRASLHVLALCAILLAGAGCGDSPAREVTKAEYQKEIQRVGTDLTRLGSELGRSIDIATFNQNVQHFQDGLDEAADDLHGLKPPPDVRDANDRLSSSFEELSDQLEAVKEARRKSILKARDALGKVGRSASIRDGRAAVRELKRKGYDVGQLGL
jgi:hypothetical protein